MSTTATHPARPSWVFLGIGGAVVVLVVAAVWAWAGWHDAVWVSWLGLFVLFEGHGIWSETPGDTLSERTRVWFATKTVAGRWGFIIFVGVLAAWFVPHILEVA